MIRKVNDRTNGRSEVCAAIVAHFHGPLSACVNGDCRGSYLASHADDIVQETFSRFWQALLNGVLEDVTVHNWMDKEHLKRIRKHLFGSARFVRFEFYRSLRGRELLDDPAIIRAPAAACPIVLSEIQAAIQQCTPAQQETFLLRQQGLSHEEIAARHSVPVETVRTHLFRARRRLRKILKDYE